MFKFTGTYSWRRLGNSLDPALLIYSRVECQFQVPVNSRFAFFTPNFFLHFDITLPYSSRTGVLHADDHLYAHEVSRRGQSARFLAEALRRLGEERGRRLRLQCTRVPLSERGTVGRADRETECAVLLVHRPRARSQRKLHQHVRLPYYPILWCANRHISTNYCFR